MGFMNLILCFSIISENKKKDRYNVGNTPVRATKKRKASRPGLRRILFKGVIIETMYMFILKMRRSIWTEIDILRRDLHVIL